MAVFAVMPYTIISCNISSIIHVIKIQKILHKNKFDYKLTFSKRTIPSKNYVENESCI